MPTYPAYGTILLGDLHGNRAVMQRALRALGLVDEEGRWCGGQRRLVQVGDMIDRGPEPLGTVEFLMRLQQEAREAGGEVVCLVGNHELYALRAGAGDHEARIGWTYNGAGANLLEWGARRAEAVDPEGMPYPEAFYAEFGPDGRYGPWLRSLPVACRVGGYVAVHAGWTPEGPASVAEAVALPAEAPALHGLVWARNQPESEILAACERLDCRGLIAGHTVRTGITSAHGGRLIQIDVGMYYHQVWAAVGLDEAGAPWALVEGAEPVAIVADGLVAEARRPAEEAPAVGQAQAAEAPRYAPGAVLRIYAAADGSYQQFMTVEGFGEMHGLPAYTGKLWTFAQGAWATRASTYFCQRIDRYARPAEPGDLPENPS